jgi:hypothetical protein
MMKSHFDRKVLLARRWSIMPARTVGDRDLKERELRVLAALCVYTNAVGVCWPSMEAICEMTGYSTRQSVHDAIKVLTQKKYIRRLRPKDYQETSTGWKSNRYQVLWDGDEPLPTYEEVDNARPLQLRTEEDGPDINGQGGLGDLQSPSHRPDQPRPGDPKLTGIQLTADEICNAYIVAVQQATGQARLYANEIAHARRLADAGHGAADVKAATLNVCDQALERRAGVPSLADVARAMSV